MALAAVIPEPLSFALAKDRAARKRPDPGHGQGGCGREQRPALQQLGIGQALHFIQMGALLRLLHTADKEVFSKSIRPGAELPRVICLAVMRNELGNASFR